MEWIYEMLLPALIVALVVVALFAERLSMRSGHNAADLQRLVAAATAPSGAYGHPFDPVAELKTELPSPPPGFMWELTVDRNAEYCHIMTLGLLHAATDKVVASTTSNLTKNGLQEWKALYARDRTSDVTDWARKVTVGRPAEWARRQKEVHTPPEGPSHHEVIA